MLGSMETEQTRPWKGVGLVGTWMNLPVELLSLVATMFDAVTGKSFSHVYQIVELVRLCGLLIGRGDRERHVCVQSMPLND